MVPKPSNRGAAALYAWLKNNRRKWGQKELAEHLGVTQPSVSRWVNGACLPPTNHAVTIAGIARIPVSAWTERAAAEKAA